MRVFVIAIALLVILAAFAGCGGYNKLVMQEEAVDAAWAQVENVYQRRADLVPNLVATVKGAADFEQETLTAVIEARAKATQANLEIDSAALDDPRALERFSAIQAELSSALARLMVVVERYPDIKANQNFRDLQVQLEGTENRIATERRRFNDTAREYNTARRRFPTAIVASLAGFGPKAYFEAEAGAQTVPAVEF